MSRPPPDRQATVLSPFFLEIIILAAVLICGAVYGWQIVAATNRAFRKDLQERARLMTQGINTDWIKALSGTANDLGKSEYRALKDQLLLISRAQPDIRFISLMGCRADGTLFFFADNEPADSPDCSPAGEIYTEASRDYQLNFIRAIDFVSGPDRDHWGNWLTAIAVIRDSQNEMPLARLAIDVDARDWRGHLAQAAMPAILMTLLLSLLTGITFACTARRRLKPAPAQPRAEIIAVAIGGCLITLFAAYDIHTREIRHRTQLFRSIVSEDTYLIAKILSDVGHLADNSTAAFIANSDKLRQDEFSGFAQVLLRNPLITCLAWAEAVPPPDKTDFENDCRGSRDPDFKIWCRQDSPYHVPGSEKTLFLPVIYASEQLSQANYLGFDLNSDQRWQEVIQEAIRKRATLSTRPLRLHPRSGARKTVALVTPVFTGERLRGVVAVGLRLETLFNRTYRLNALGEMRLFFPLRDQPAILLADSFTPRATPAEPALFWPFYAFGNLFHLYVRPAPHFTSQHPVWKVWIAIPFGLLLTAVLSVVTRQITCGRQKLEAIISTRTAELQESQSWFARLASQRRTVMWEIDATGLFRKVSANVQDFWGYQPEELTGRQFFHDLHPDPEQEGDTATARELFALRQPFFEFITPVICKNGGRLLVSTNAIPAFNAQGELTGYHGSDRDVTEQQRREHDLRQAAKLQKMLLEISTDYINLPLDRIDQAIETALDKMLALVAADRAFIFSGQPGRKTWTNTHSYCRDGITGLDPDHRQVRLPTEWEQRFAAGLPVCIANTSGLPDAETRSLLEQEGVKSAVLVPLVDGRQCCGFVGFDFVRNYHLHSEAEISLLSALAQMLVNVEKRREIEALLLLSRQKAEEATRAKGTFLSNMSHEIRTPMNAVIGMTSLLLDSKLTARQRQYAEIIRSSGEGLLNLINDILDFSKIEARKLTLECRDFCLPDLLDEFTAMMGCAAGLKGLELFCEISPDTPAWIRGDARRLRQILTNLAGNAVKFTPHGDVTIRINRSALHGRPAIAFAISDTGIGIAADKLPLLFQPFSQADQEIGRDFGGTGLGLLITKELTEMMQGRINVSSVSGQGSTFTVIIPFATAESAANAEPPLPAADLERLRVLIIAMHPACRRHLQQKLAWSGIRAHGTDNVAAAIDLLQQDQATGSPWQAVIANSDLTAADYESLFARLQQLPQPPRLIMLNPLAAKGDAAQFRDHPGLVCIDKPLRHNEPAATLAAICLSQPEPAAPSPIPAPPPQNAEPAATNIQVLLAEDVVPNQLLTVALLKKIGVHTDVVNNGQEALHDLQRKKYALVLMDVQMPVMDGFAATREIRNPHSPVPDHAIPIIAMTAHAMEGDREHCLQQGMDDYLSKPITPKQLYDTLKRWLPLPPR